MLQSFIDLLFPQLCIGCNQSLVFGEKHLCTDCILHLPETNYHLQVNNPVEKIFWGRIPIVSAYSFLSFKKQGIVQRLLHDLKYGNNPEVGELLGMMYAQRLATAGIFPEIVLAVPLHPKKLKLRGYNQSECFAKGISSVLGCKHSDHIIIRKRATETQTRKSRFARWENVGRVFEVKKPELVFNKKILLVDDVITTGATIEACAQTIIPFTNSLSIGSIACVVHQ